MRSILGMISQQWGTTSCLMMEYYLAFSYLSSSVEIFEPQTFILQHTLIGSDHGKSSLSGSWFNDFLKMQFPGLNK